MEIIKLTLDIHISQSFKIIDFIPDSGAAGSAINRDIPREGFSSGKSSQVSQKQLWVKRASREQSLQSDFFKERKRYSNSSIKNIAPSA
eukprot:snap_masked-scaffold_74-processed-gene-0.43-mRNA-1 protein AED:1.00 eAED:1.00 QI:0/-1/0/0/-1/1/1/0/88